VRKVLRVICGFTREVVVMGVEVADADRAGLVVHVRPKVRRRGRCRRCGQLAAWLDNGGGTSTPRWRPSSWPRWLEA
jgi:hypothetical protein